MGYSSQAGQLILRKQTVQGTLAADLGTAGVAIRLKAGSFGTKRDLLVPDAEIGGGRDTAGAYLGAVSWSGDFDFYCRADAMATLLQGVLGTAAAPVTVTGMTTHTITPSDANQLPFFSVEERIGSGLEVYNYTDVVINTLHVESDANGYLTGKVGLIGAKQVAGATATAVPLWDITPMMVGTNINLTFGGTALSAKSFGLDINNNYDDTDFRLGSFYIGDLTPKKREVTGKFTVRHTSSALWRQATYGAIAAVAAGGTTVMSPLVIDAKSYEDIQGATPPGTKYSIGFTIPNFILTPFSFAASADDVLENDIEGTAVRPSLATPIVTAVIKTGKITIS